METEIGDGRVTIKRDLGVRNVCASAWGRRFYRPHPSVHDAFPTKFWCVTTAATGVED
jgi:hypothetical protein